MVRTLEFIFSDAWHFLGTIVILIICIMWKPIDITVVTRGDGKKLDE